MSPETSNSNPADHESIRHVTFESLEAAQAILNDLTLEDCLRTAHQEYLTLLSVAKLLKMGDRELEATIRSEEPKEMWLDLLDEIVELKKRGRGLLNLYDAAEARLLIVLARLSDTEKQ